MILSAYNVSTLESLVTTIIVTIRYMISDDMASKIWEWIIVVGGSLSLRGDSGDLVSVKTPQYVL